ncbi:MAG: inositol monophosphatase family protein [Candidatus Hodarchaeales archaeon]
MKSLKSFFQVAQKVSEEAGQILLEFYGKTTISHKPDFSIVTEADITSDRFIRKELTTHFPDHSIFSEELGELKHKHESGYTWVIDPLDGTNNFSARHPFFCVSIGLLKDHEPVLGVVYFPFQKELFSALKGKGAFLNGNKMTCSSNKQLEDVLIAVGNGSDLPSRERIVKLYSKLKIQNFLVRHAGAAALELCYVAAGRFGAFIMDGLKPWDVVAGALIVKEAGGTISDFNGNEYRWNSPTLVAASNNLFSRFVNIIRL